MNWSLFATICVLVTFKAYAGSLRLAWDAPSGVITGYRLYYGQTSGHYSTVLETGPLTQASVSGLTDGVAYFFAVTALNTAGESPYSEEISALPRPDPIQDTIPPLARIMSPRDGETVPRRVTVTIVVEATDNVGVAEVTLAVNDEQLFCTGSALYTCAWRVPAANKRRYVLQAMATDTSNNQGFSPRVEVISE